MAAYTIQHDWTHQNIEMLTKRELADGINESPTNFASHARVSMPKDELVILGIAVRDELKRRHNEEEAKAAAQHAIDLARDLEHPRYMAAVKLIAESFHKKAADARDKVNKALAKVVEDVRGELSWQFQTLAFESQLESYAKRSAEYFDEIVEKHELTIAEFRDRVLDRLTTHYEERVLERSFSSSTNPASNLCDEQEFEVIRKMVKMLRRVEESFDHDMAAAVDAPFHTEYLGYIY